MAKPREPTTHPKPGKKSSGSKRPVGRPRKRRRPRAKKAATNEPPGSESVGRLERTRRLLLAALRVWELKRRVRD